MVFYHVTFYRNTDVLTRLVMVLYCVNPRPGCTYDAVGRVIVLILQYYCSGRVMVLIFQILTDCLTNFLLDFPFYLPAWNITFLCSLAIAAHLALSFSLLLFNLASFSCTVSVN